MGKHVKTAEAASRHTSRAAAVAISHALFWLVVMNAIGVLIALLLLLPGLNAWLGEWTYGRWMIVHMNLALYGWCSLPMVGFLFQTYGADRGRFAAWCRPVVWLWSAALVVGSASWLAGHSSGKLFLDWTGFARVFFPLAMFALWLLLATAYVYQNRKKNAERLIARIAKITGLAVLLTVPFTIYFAASPGIYPAVNPDTGGPTGASQLESSLGIILILLIVPFGIAQRIASDTRMLAAAWGVLIAEALLCGLLDHQDVSHHRPPQFLSLGSILIWLPLVPAYYRCFAWNPATKLWRKAFLWWWGGLALSGWIFFLPGVLDRFKFTDGLVGHSLTAVAGFLTAYLIFVMVQLLGENDAWIFNRRWSFYAWNWGVLAYVLVMTIAGWLESDDPAFTIVPGAVRNVLYAIRLVTGLAMLVSSIEWLVSGTSLTSLRTKYIEEAKGAEAA